MARTGSRPALRRLLILTVVLASGILAFRLASPVLGHYLIEPGTTTPCHAEAILVLAGDWRGDRIRRAAELVRDGFAPKAYISGPPLYGTSEAQLAINYAVGQGARPEWFEALPNLSNSTQSEAALLLPQLRARGVQRFILLTSDYHTRRSTYIYRRAAQALPFCTAAAKDPNFHPDWPWANRESAKTFFYEWIKTFSTWWEA